MSMFTGKYFLNLPLKLGNAHRSQKKINKKNDEYAVAFWVII